ncbi:MAG TPA: BON domain-containing protein [Pirellulales bacterium]|nr:BON domain-containing protein [Pirellulales bacterium]
MADIFLAGLVQTPGPAHSLFPTFQLNPSSTAVDIMPSADLSFEARQREEQLAEQFEERVSNALRQNPHLHTRNLRFEASEGRVTLKGQVSSWYQKQMAQETLFRLDGIDRVENQLEVNWV